MSQYRQTPKWIGWAPVFLIMVLACQTGCGTLLSRSGETDQYSNTKWYAGAIYSGTILDLRGLSNEQLRYLAFFDLPLSLAADTIVLPLSLYEETFTGYLQSAALNGDEAGVSEKLTSGTSINQTDWQGHTALMAAAWGGHERLVKLLLEKGADPQLRAKSGHTAWSYAEKWKEERPEIHQVIEGAGGKLFRRPMLYTP